MYNTTMNVATFDTYRFIKRLKDAGIAEDHAEAEADALSEAMGFNLDKLATKEDIKDRATKADLAELKVDMIKYMLAITLAQAALVVSLIELLK